MAGIKITELTQADAMSAAASFVITQPEETSGQTVEAARRADAAKAVAALRTAGVNAGYSTVGDTGHILLANRTARRGNINNSGNWNNITSAKIYSHKLIEITAGDSVYISAQATTAAYYGFLTSDSAPVNNEPVPFCTGTGLSTVSMGHSGTATAPEGAQFLLVMIVRNDIDVTPTVLNIGGINQYAGLATAVKSAIDATAVNAAAIEANAGDIATNAEDIATNAEAITGHGARISALEAAVGGDVKWCAMGDSITEGVYSVKEWDVEHERFVGVAHTNKVDTWVWRVARAKGWTLTNLGVGGTGFIDPKNGVDEGDLERELRGWWVARNTDFSQFDLITVAYGVNDYNSNVELGTLDTETDWAVEVPHKIIHGIQAVIEGIMLTATTAKIIFITPLNERGYKNLQWEDTRGTYADNYALGWTLSKAGTLKSVRDAIIECCEYYGIEYIDQSYSSIINRLTLKADVDSLAPDGVHPSLEAHKALAREMYSKLHCGPSGDV